MTIIGQRTSTDGAAAHRTHPRPQDLAATAIEPTSARPAPADTATTATEPRPAAHSGYTGPDRRKPVTTRNLRGQLLRTIGAAAVMLALWATVAVIVNQQGRMATHSLISLTHSVSGGLLLIAAALVYAYWRIAGTAGAACAVVALTVAGVSLPLMGVLTRNAATGLTDIGTTALLGAAVELVVIGWAAATFALPEVVSRVRPLRLATPFAGGALLAAGLVLARGDTATTPLLGTIAGAMRTINAVLWCALIVVLLLRAHRRRSRIDLVFAAALLLPAASSIARDALGPFVTQSSIVAAGLTLLTATVCAGGASVALWILHTGQGTRLLNISGQLHATRTDLADLQSAQSQRLHDARNAIFAIAGAVDMLVHADAENAATTLHPEHLQRLITAELNRLGHLLDPTFHGEVTAFTTAELLRPLLGAYRAQGMTISEDIDGSHITGRRDLIAGAITNILTNARVHAPGARIWVTTATVYDAAAGQAVVRIDIADDGPGIPAEQRASVLQPGVRGLGVTVPGSGLGLASAAQSLAEAGGTLRLSERPGGGALITLKVPVELAEPTDISRAVATPATAGSR